MRAERVVIGAVLVAAALSTRQPSAQQQPGIDAAAVRAAIERALTVAPRGFQALQAPAQTGVRVLDVDVARTPDHAHVITIDLSQRTLTYDPNGDPEVITDHVVAATAPLTAGARDVHYRFLVDGLPLDQFVSRAAPAPLRARALAPGGRVVVSAGHGWYLHGSGSWRLQRDYYWGIVEDFVNFDIARYLQAELAAAGIDARPARHPDVNAGAGESGHPRWQEAAKYFIRDLGTPPSVWDVGVDDYAKDINVRPFYANWIDSAAIISIHNNGGGGTGTETWYDATNGQEHESRRLAQILNDRIVQAIRARYNPDWPDRGLRTCNGCKGETRLANRPAVIVEVAFMDTRSPDNAALHSEAFKQIVAQAIREGLQEWAGLPLVAIPDADAQARRDMMARASQDARFGALIDGSFGVNTEWELDWELRWADFAFAGGRRVTLFHMTQRANRSVRYLGFSDPDTGDWVGWQPAS